MSRNSLLFDLASEYSYAFLGLFTKVWLPYCVTVFFFIDAYVFRYVAIYILFWYSVISEVKGIPDESDRFMMDPIGFISEFAKNWCKPSHIILFESEEKHLKDFLLSQSFEEVQYFLEVATYFNYRSGWLANAFFVHV